ncbi:MAG: glycosyltransferase [Sulfurisoma sp.]|nr:glycosyltransferase [Sulfurisoma sp.]
MRVLVLDTGNEWGGGTNSLIELLRRIDRSRFDITTCFYHDYGRGRDSSISNEMATIGIPFVRLPGRRQPPWAKLAKELARGLLGWNRRLRAAAVFAIERRWRIVPRARAIAALLKSGGYDLLYLNNQPSSNLEGYLAGEAAGVPVVQHCRIDATLNAVEIAATNRVARAVICVSNGVADSLRGQGIAADRLVVVHNAIDGKQVLPAPLPLPGVPPGTLVVGTVGQLVKRKSVDDLLRAVARAGQAFHVVIVGEGPEAGPLAALAESLGLAGRVHFAGFQQQPLPWLAAMDVFVLASSKEGLPRVILEAMLLGKPVIAARVVGARELVVENETGYLYDHADIAALAAHLAKLAAAPALRAELGARGRQRVLADFSIERYVAGVEAVLADAVGGTTHGTSA